MMDAIKNLEAIAAPELQTLLATYDFSSQWHEIQRLLSNVQNHAKNTPLNMGDGDELEQQESIYEHIEEEYDELVNLLEEKIGSWKIAINGFKNQLAELASDQQKDAVQHLENLLSISNHAILAMHKAIQKQQQYAAKARLLEEVGNITSDLIGDRRQQSPNAPIHHTDPLDDLRLINTRVHTKLKAIIDQTPSLRIKICYLIYRSQNIQAALDEKEAQGEVDA